MKIEDIRLANLRLLIKERGSLTAVADAAGTAMNYLSQIINGTRAPNGKVRSVGTKLARKLEKGCGKPDGWMDLEEDANPDIAEILRIHKGLDENLKQSMLEQVRLLHKIQQSNKQ